jgi:hypothetical protein
MISRAVNDRRCAKVGQAGCANAMLARFNLDNRNEAQPCMSGVIGFDDCIAQQRDDYSRVIHNGINSFVRLILYPIDNIALCRTPSPQGAVSVGTSSGIGIINR